MIRLKVREIARQKNISQRQLIIRSGLDIRIVQRVLRNPQTNITLATLDKLAKALEIDAKELIESIPDEDHNFLQNYKTTDISTENLTENISEK